MLGAMKGAVQKQRNVCARVCICIYVYVCIYNMCVCGVCACGRRHDACVPATAAAGRLLSMQWQDLRRWPGAGRSGTYVARCLSQILAALDLEALYRRGQIERRPQLAQQAPPQLPPAVCVDIWVRWPDQWVKSGRAYGCSGCMHYGYGESQGDPPERTHGPG